MAAKNIKIKPLSAAKAQMKIDLFLNLFSETSLLSQEQQKFLRALKSDLHDINLYNPPDKNIHDESESLSDKPFDDSMINEFTFKDGEITQLELYERTRKWNEELWEMTDSTIKFLLKEIDNEIIKTKAANRKNTRSYLKLLEKVKYNLAAVIIKIDILKEEKDAYFSGLFNGINKYSQLLLLLGGRHKPFSQAFDPFLGINKIEGGSDGYCHGHSLQWCETIVKYGSGKSFNPRVGYKTFMRQKYSELVPDITALTNYRNPKNKTFSCDKNTDLLALMEQLINSLKTTEVYYISNNPSWIGHGVGIRRLPKSNTIEFFDPNFGIVVFDDLDACKHWLAAYFSDMNQYMIANDSADKPRNFSGFLQLIPVGKQPANAKPSIPLLKVDPGLSNHLNKNFFSSITNSVEELDYKLKHQEVVLSHVISNEKDREIAIFNQLSITRYLQHVKVVPAEYNLVSVMNNMPLVYSYFNVSCPETIDSINATHEVYKKNVIKLLQKEIKRLEGTWIGHSDAKVRALKALVADIKNAPLHEPLEMTVKKWLAKKTNGNTKTNDQTIAQHRLFNAANKTKTTTEIFIKKLTRELEISPYRMNLIYSAIINKVMEISKHYQLDLHNRFENQLNNGNSLRTVFKKFHHFAQVNAMFKLPGLPHFNNIMTLMKNVDLNNMQQLNDCFSRLDDYSKDPLNPKSNFSR